MKSFKVLSVLIPLLLSTTVVHASSSCDNLADAAKNIMIMRQAGTSAQTMFQMTEGLPQNAQNTLKRVIIDAYEVPAMSTAETRVKITDEFTNKWYLACIKGSN